MEIYRFFFILSIIYLIYIIITFIIKLINNFIFGNSTFILNWKEKIILWLSLTLFIAYLTK